MIQYKLRTKILRPFKVKGHDISGLKVRAYLLLQDSNCSIQGTSTACLMGREIIWEILLDAESEIYILQKDGHMHHKSAHVEE